MTPWKRLIVLIDFIITIKMIEFQNFENLVRIEMILNNFQYKWSVRLATGVQYVYAECGKANIYNDFSQKGIQKKVSLQPYK